MLQCGQYLSLSDVSLHLAVANFDLVLSEVQVEEEEVGRGQQIFSVS